MMQQTNYEAVMDAALVDLKTYLESDKWEQTSDKNGFKTYTMKAPDSDFLLSKGEGVIPYKLEEILAIIEDIQNRAEYDDMCESGSVIQKLGEKFMIFYQKFKGMFFIVSARDFVILSKAYIDENVVYTVGKSVDGVHPEQKSIVRGTINLAGWKLERLPEGTRCQFMTWVDPKGNVPTKAVNHTAAMQGKIVESIKNLLDKKAKK